MQRVDRIERRRFVGNEFLLYLWFESEVRDGTLSTREHGDFGLWIEKRLILTAGRESTRITAPFPGLGREAKEALLRGQLPQSAGVRLERADEPASFVLKAEQLAVSGLKLGSVLDADDDEGPNPLLEPQRPAPRKSRKADESDMQHEAFYERMHLTQSFESVLESLYRDFLTLRLGPAYAELIYPALKRWVRGDNVDYAQYEAERDRYLGRGSASSESNRTTDIRTLREKPWAKAGDSDASGLDDLGIDASLLEDSDDVPPEAALDSYAGPSDDRGPNIASAEEVLDKGNASPATGESMVLVDDERADEDGRDGEDDDRAPLADGDAA
ncbi:MAG: hypothetical protein RL385_2929 [Pseudomonadota bacterium]|jgi:hypothetical protein